MKPEPPRGLPSGYRDLYRSVRQAEEGASSRAELARRLGVSTHTLQRILVDGDVPDFTRPQGRRLVLAWVRTLTTLATRLRRDPRPWIEAVGIAWDDRVERAASAARARDEAALAAADGDDPLAAIRARARQGMTEPVEALLVDRPFFADPLPGGDRSFLQACVELTVGAVDPAWGVRWRTVSPAEAVDRLVAPAGEAHVVAGLFETAHLRGRGLEFVRLPGWRVALRALWVGARGRPPSWKRLAAGLPETMRVVVRADDPAETMARRQWRMPSERVLVRNRTGAEALADVLCDEAARRPGGAVLVADAPTVDRVAALLDARDGFGAEARCAVIHPPRDAGPAYPLTIAVRAGADRWRELLAHAWREDLLTAQYAETAALHAGVLALGARASASAPDDAPVTAGSVAIEPMPEAPPPFSRHVVREFLAATAAAAAPGRDVAAAWDRAIRVVHATIPAPWHDHIAADALAMRREAVEGAGGELRPFRAFCHSCSTSLLESPGKSACYCRYCADESGELRPREEVQKILAHWMRGWQGGLEEKESMDRAARFMSTMPAWSTDH